MTKKYEKYIDNKRYIKIVIDKPNIYIVEYKPPIKFSLEKGNWKEIKNP